MNESTTTWYAALTTRREALGLTQKALAQRIGRVLRLPVSDTTLSRWETGTREPMTFYRRAWEHTLAAAERRRKRKEQTG
jgi:transcriptional regulator with XRE-family HTH domain